MKSHSRLLILLALLCAGCPHPLWLPDRNLKEYVKEEDVVGTWTLQPDSLALLTRDAFQTNATQRYSVQFLTNGDCTFESVLAEFRGGTYHEVNGRWMLEHDTTGGSNIKKKSTIQLDLPLPSGRHVRYLNFDKVDGALILWQFYGDPDSWEFMEYKKAEQVPGHIR